MHLFAPVRWEKRRLEQCGTGNAKAFNVINLFFRYRFPDQASYWNGVALTLNIDNVFDANPSTEFEQLDSIGNNGQTLGHMFTIGIKKTF